MVGLRDHDGALSAEHVRSAVHGVIGVVARIVAEHIVARHAAVHGILLHDAWLVIAGFLVAAHDDAWRRACLVERNSLVEPVFQNARRLFFRRDRRAQHHNAVRLESSGFRFGYNIVLGRDDDVRVRSADDGGSHDHDGNDECQHCLHRPQHGMSSPKVMRTTVPRVEPLPSRRHQQDTKRPARPHKEQPPASSVLASRASTESCFLFERSRQPPNDNRPNDARNPCLPERQQGALAPQAYAKASCVPPTMPCRPVRPRGSERHLTSQIDAKALLGWTSVRQGGLE